MYFTATECRDFVAANLQTVWLSWCQNVSDFFYVLQYKLSKFLFSFPDTVISAIVTALLWDQSEHNSEHTFPFEYIVLSGAEDVVVSLDMFTVCRHCHADGNGWKEHVQTEWVATASSTQNTLSSRQTDMHTVLLLASSQTLAKPQASY